MTVQDNSAAKRFLHFIYIYTDTVPDASQTYYIWDVCLQNGLTNQEQQCLLLRIVLRGDHSNYVVSGKVIAQVCTQMLHALIFTFANCVHRTSDKCY